MKTLIAYVSKHGCTADCALKLAQNLPGEVSLVDLAKETPDLSPYDDIILGAPIYAGNIPGEAKNFYNGKLEELTTKKLGIFVSCGHVDKGLEQLDTAFPQELVNHAAVRKSFGGELSLEKQNFIVRLFLKQVMKIKESYRLVDDAAIAEFATQWSS